MKHKGETMNGIVWICRCGFSTESGQEAFIHRDIDGGSVHHIAPLAAPRMTGIEKELLRNEIHIVAVGK